MLQGARHQRAALQHVVPVRSTVPCGGRLEVDFAAFAQGGGLGFYSVGEEKSRKKVWGVRQVQLSSCRYCSPRWFAAPAVPGVPLGGREAALGRPPSCHERAWRGLAAFCSGGLEQVEANRDPKFAFHYTFHTCGQCPSRDPKFAFVLHRCVLYSVVCVVWCVCIVCCVCVACCVLCVVCCVLCVLCVVCCVL